MNNANHDEIDFEKIAIIGISGRFPGAQNIEEFWDNLVNGKDSITYFTDEELAESGIDISEISGNPNYVRAAGVLEGVEYFDTSFFQMTPKESELTDPQHRVLMETCWEALEDSGYTPDKFNGDIGVYAGKAKNTYLYHNLSGLWSTGKGAENLLVTLGNEPDYMTTKISYKLNLTGPSVCIHTACSTSLVSVYSASQALLNYECDMALAGGVCILLPQKQGHWYHEGHFSSPDGRTRSFDISGEGTLFSNGVGVVVLKRLSEALEDGDDIYAVIRGSAINNDGMNKVGFMAPSVNGQAEVIAMAMADAQIKADMISYIEGHGTATPLGDPIEVEALTQAFRAHTDAKGFCRLGSVKSNIGHLDAAAGAAGLIKTVLSLKNKVIPPTIHFKEPNSKFDIDNTPFTINAKLTPWEQQAHSNRIAGVSSFGVGGTNAHVILEEAPEAPVIAQAGSPSEENSRDGHVSVFPISARSYKALDGITDNLLRHLKGDNNVDIKDVAYTLQIGRKDFEYRRIVTGQRSQEIIDALETRNPKQVFTKKVDSKKKKVAFMFSGQGAQRVNMGLNLYKSEPVFRETMDECASIASRVLDADIIAIIYPQTPADVSDAAEALRKTLYTQPVLFCFEYALAKLFISWGITPYNMIGHSIGEYVCACVAEVLSIEDAVRLVCARSKLMQSLPGGCMMAVAADENDVQKMLPKTVSVAAINSLQQTVVTGHKKDILLLKDKLDKDDISCVVLKTSHAFHSPMLDPILNAFENELKNITFHKPKIDYISCLTGTWTTGDILKPAYWVRQMRQPVRFADGRMELLKNKDLVLLEIGPDGTLCKLASNRAYKNNNQTVIPSMGETKNHQNEPSHIAEALGKLWLEGIGIKWEALHDPNRKRLHLPTYPFERKYLWVEMKKSTPHDAVTEGKNFSIKKDNATQVNEAEHKGTHMQASKSIEKERKKAVIQQLLDLFSELGGIDRDEIATDASFMDMGFDSLFLTQASTAIKKKFKIKITFRQLLEDTTSLELLSNHLNKEIPDDTDLEFMQIANALEPLSPVIEPAVEPQSGTRVVNNQPVAENPAEAMNRFAVNRTNPTPLSNNQVIYDPGTLQHLVQQQINLMNRHIDLLASGTIPASVSQSHDNTAFVESSGLVAAEKVVSSPIAEMVAKEPSSESADEVKKSERFGPWKPFDKTAIASDLTDDQRKALNELIKAYTDKTKTSKEMTQRHRSHFADPRTATGFNKEWKELVYPIVVERSKGSRLWDVDGNEYTDIQSGFGSIFFGHNPDFIKTALEKQLERGVQIGPQSHLAGEVARSMCRMVGMDRVAFCNTGSEAVLAAMRMSRTVTGNMLIVTFSKDYHGIFDEVLVRSTNIKGKRASLPVSPGIPRDSVKNMLVLDYGNPESIEIIKRHAGEIAAVLVEPVQSRQPNLQPASFLKELRRLTLEKQIPLIFDEVITGFRLGPGGAQQWYGIEADIATYGKIIGGGMPIGAVAGKREYMDTLDGGMWNYGDASFPEVGVTYFAGTFVRHPLAIAAADAVLVQLNKSGQQLYDEMNNKAKGLVDDLNHFFEKTGAAIHLQRCGSLVLIDFKSDIKFNSLLFFYLRLKGVHILEGGAFFLTVAHTREDIEFINSAFKESVREMASVGFMPAGQSMKEFEKEASIDVPKSQRVPLTESQQDIWFASKLGDDISCAYNESDSLELTGEVDVDVLKQAIQIVIKRHDALHVKISPDGEFQEVMSTQEVEIAFHDFSGYANKDETDEKLNAFFQKEASTPFNIEKGPLIRPSILKTAKDEYIFNYYVHHMVCDGWAAGILLKEVGTAYSALVRGMEPVLPKAVSFLEYAQAKPSAIEEKTEALEFWMNKFRDSVPVLEVPTDNPRPAVRSFNGGTLKVFLGHELNTMLKKFSANYNVTMFATLLATFKVLLHRLSNQDDITVGINVAGQALEGKDYMVGHCVKLLPFRSQIDGDATFHEFLTALRGNVMDAYEHHQCTLGNLLRHLKVERNTSRAPIIEAIFNYAGERTNVKFDGLRVRLLENPRAYVHVDMFFNIMEDNGDLIIDWDYSTSLFRPSTIERWAQHYKTLLESIVQDIDQPISHLQILSEEERQKILNQWQ